MSGKQGRFPDGDLRRPSTTKPRRSSFAFPPRTPERARPWDAVDPVVVEVNSSSRPSTRIPRQYHGTGHLRSTSGDYTSRPSQRVSSTEGALNYDHDGIRVYAAEPDQSSSMPFRETYSTAHVPRNFPPLNYDPSRPIPTSRTQPIKIPKIDTAAAALHSSYPAPPQVFPYGTSPHNLEPPSRSFESMRISSDSRSSGDLYPPPMVFHHSQSSHSTDRGGDKAVGGSKLRRRNSVREEEFRFPRDREQDGEQRSTNKRRSTSRPSLNRQPHLNPSPMSSGLHSRNTSDEGVFFPPDDLPQRKRSLREIPQSAGYSEYPWQFPYTTKVPPLRYHGNVTLHQSAYNIAAATGAFAGTGSYPTRRESHAEGPLSEIWIAVMGVTGCGKSTFIQTATGDSSVGVHHGLRSHTREVEVHSVRIGGFKINLIDTPGFDDTSRSETEVLQSISAHLAKAYRNKIYLNGIIYIHSILQPRMGGSDIRSVGILERLVGEQNMSSVLLVTNNWDAIGPSVATIDGRKATGQEVGEKREKELYNVPEFWGNLIKLGARTSRHRGDSWQSAHKLISHFLAPEQNSGIGRPIKLLLQHELVDNNMRLEQTTVGDFINAKLYEGQKLLEKGIEDLRKRYQRTVDGYSSGSGKLEELGTQLEEKKKGLKDVRKNAEILGKRVDDLVDEHGQSVNTPISGRRISGAHGGLCEIM